MTFQLYLCVSYSVGGSKLAWLNVVLCEIKNPKIFDLAKNVVVDIYFSAVDLLQP